MRSVLLPMLSVCLLAGFPPLVRAAADPLDWPNWRGPLQNSSSPATNLPDEWDPRGGEGSNLLWKSDELGGRSTPIVMQGKLFTLVRNHADTKLEGEKLVCLDAATGEKKWEYDFNVYLSDVPDTRVGWSTVVGDPETGRVYALGVGGYFCCLEGDTGKLLWDRSLHEEYGLLSTYGGRTNSPLIYGDTVLISAVVIGWGDTPQWGLLAKPAHRFMAFDKATGELRWLKGTNLIPYDTTYSTPSLTKLNGVDAIVFGSGDGGVWALQAGTGLPLWEYPLSTRGLNVSPLVTPDGRVFTSHSEENTIGTTMGAIVALDGNLPGDSAGKELWKKYQVMAGKSSPVMVDNKLIIVDDRAKMYMYDAETGEQIAKRALGTVQRSTPLYADGKLYVCTNNGRWYILKPTDKGLDIVHRMRINRQSSDGSPIVAQGRIYVPMSDALYCIGNDESIAAAKAQAKELDPIEPLTPQTSSAEPSHVQVVPYDTICKPGESQQYTVRLYDAKGNYIRNANADEVEFNVTGAGQVDSAGKYEAASEGQHQSALVTCSMGDLKGEARIRVVPSLPWKFDFESAEDVPLTWVGGRIRYVMREEGGNKYIAKPTELPTRPGAPTTKLGTRSRMWMGSPEMEDYTVVADVQLKVGQPGVESEEGEELPEAPNVDGAFATLPSIGLINSRYTFALFGPSQEVRLYSWCTHPKRTQATKSMQLDPHKWYTLKLKVVPEGDHAHVYGKVWPRDTDEPEEWTLELNDEAPNLQGAPGLFGDAKVAEIYVDNIEVTEN